MVWSRRHTSFPRPDLEHSEDGLRNNAPMLASGRHISYNRGMSLNAYTRAAALPAILAQRIVILAGALGTMIQRCKLSKADFGGEPLEGHRKDLKRNNDLLQLTRPDVIREIHEQYLEAGADIVETNTFGATSVAQDDYGDRKSTRLNSSHPRLSRMPSSA